MTGPSDRHPAFPRGRWSYQVEARSNAPVADVWSLLGEARRWKEWSFLDRSDLERSGSPDPDGVGAIRRFTRFGVGSREEVVVFEPPHHLGYVILSGFPVRNYRSDIVLSPDETAGTGTHLSWSGTFDVKVPGTGRVLEFVLQRMITRFASGATSYADRHGPPIP